MGKKPDIPDSTKSEMILFLLENSRNGQPARGMVNEAATKFSCSRKTISRIWETAKQQRSRGELLQVTSKRQARIRKLKYEVNHDQIAQVHYQKRGSIRVLVDSIKIPKSTVGRWAKRNLIRAHTNAIKPDLTAQNKLLRLSFSLQATEYDNALKMLKFKPMENIVHIDEKWFYLTKNTHIYYLTHSESEPHRTCKNKKFIPKVMFMCAVSRPIFSELGSVIFYGKIGMWPFVEEVAAKRNNKKRAAGTLEIKPIQSITKEVIKDCLIKQVLPAIKNNWPSCLSTTILIQQENARPHINNAGQEFLEAANSDGFHISLVQQPPNSPDLNVNDLGYFRAIQSLQQQQACQNASELINAVIASFNNLEAMTLNNVFLSLQCCFQEIMKVKGCNHYKLPHMKKDALLLQNALPKNLEIPIELVKECIDFLIQAGQTKDIGAHIRFGDCKLKTLIFAFFL